MLLLKLSGLIPIPGTFASEDLKKSCFLAHLYQFIYTSVFLDLFLLRVSCLCFAYKHLFFTAQEVSLKPS